MKAIKTIFDVLVVAFVLFTALLLTAVLDENEIFRITSEIQRLNLYMLLVAAGSGLAIVKLLVNKLYINAVKHDLHMAQLKINELKADLYEKRQAFRSNSYRHSMMEEAIAS
ncbi:hypothetical protein [Pontibacter vulgaris]|uniref:hypothetical protein n=1 Tax=Pontibacter vulgaris TaxID=2905679 RepID=UPI001FA73B93|nr:hypothetical protein [Pontibacter vulgaris]